MTAPPVKPNPKNLPHPDSSVSARTESGTGRPPSSRTKSTRNAPHKTIRRYWAILRQLPPTGRSVTTAHLRRLLEALGFEVTQKTVQRDLANLAREFPAIEHDGGSPRGWWWNDGSAPRPPGFGLGAGDTGDGSSRRIQLDIIVSSRVLDDSTMQCIFNRDGKTSALSDGRTRINITVPDTQSLRVNLAKFGPEVEVVGPSALREEFAESARRLNALYREDSSSHDSR